MKYKNIPEEELKNKVARDWFSKFDTTVITGNIDFSLYPKAKGPGERVPLLWAEAKTGDYDLAAAFVQLVLTLGRARTFARILPPAWLAAFDGRKIAFVPWASIADIFTLNDFNWHAAPSDHASREFRTVRTRIEATLAARTATFDFEADAAPLRAFIAGPLAAASATARIAIDRNSFYPIYLRWLDAVKPCIDVDWAALRAHGILDSDFFLADLFVDDRDTVDISDDVPVRTGLFVTFGAEGYRIARENLRALFDAIIAIRDRAAYQAFWARYKRPPLAAAQEWIIVRRDLLVPQDIRERKGAFFTPRQWVELSQRYLADTLGEAWQEEYYVWDCAAGTGNLLAGLTNKYRIFVSTLDAADVSAMRERAAHGANLLPAYTFQFDFLNDPFIPQSRGGKLPDDLYDIITHEEKRKRLVIYINPPYAEVGSKKQIASTGTNKSGVAHSKTYEKYWPVVGAALRDLFAQFLIRIYMEIPSATIANFSTLKLLQASNFSAFRQVFRANLANLYIVPANTFDNVRGKFPIGFYIWNTAVKAAIPDVDAAVYDEKGVYQGVKTICMTTEKPFINRWITNHRPEEANAIGWLQGVNRNDFQDNQMVYLINNRRQVPGPRGVNVTIDNLRKVAIYFAVRKCISLTWLNNQDQFFQPNDEWMQDCKFQNDCFAYTLFHDKNNIRSSIGPNHWIPFTEEEVGAQRAFTSHFMTDFMRGKCKPTQPKGQQTIIPLAEEISLIPQSPMVFSAEAQAVFSAGRTLWSYYHAQPHANPNASYYDIREHFQGRNAKGIMNAKSDDAQYTELLAALRTAVKALGDRIAPRVYEYGFLKH